MVQLQSGVYAKTAGHEDEAMRNPRCTASPSGGDDVCGGAFEQYSHVGRPRVSLPLSPFRDCCIVFQ